MFGAGVGVADAGGSWFRSVCLPVEAASVGRARRLAREVASEWGHEELGEDLTVCASELATNALRHARWDLAGLGEGSPGRLVVSFRLAGVGVERSLWLSVRDDDGRLPTLRPRVDVDALALDSLADVARLAESGAGLHLVRELADELGWRKVLGGKLVWCRFAIKPAG